MRIKFLGTCVIKTKINSTTFLKSVKLIFLRVIIFRYKFDTGLLYSHTFLKMLGLSTISKGKTIAYVVLGIITIFSCYRIFTIYKSKFRIGFRELRGSELSVAMTLDNLFQKIFCFYHCKKVSDITIFF